MSTRRSNTTPNQKAARTRSARPSAAARSRTATPKRGKAQEPSVSIPVGDPSARPSVELTETRIGDLRKVEREKRLKRSSRRYLTRIFVIFAVIVALLAGWAALYNSSAFAIQNVKVEGVEHLTSDEMAQLANVPKDTTLLRVDTDTIRSRLMKNAWVEDAVVRRDFPDTLTIAVTERSIRAIVEVPNRSGTAVKSWAIAQDHMWLMPIPEPDSDAAKTTSAKIYEDAEGALRITDVPYGTEAEIGTICTDANVNNALDIVSGMTTNLANQVVTVSAAGPAETTLLLDNGVEIAFGKAEDIRDKERVVERILADNPDSVSYINVRMVETPTWRSI